MHRFSRLLAVVAALLGAGAAIVVAGAPARADRVPDRFVHPGVLVSAAQLDFVRAKVQRGEEPWKRAFEQMMRSKYADLSREPEPRRIVECGSYSRPNHGCTDEREDAIAAYTTALAWYITGDERYARQSIALMDAWSGKLAGHTNSNAPLQAAWAGSVWPRAAEIIRHAYGRWDGAARFRRMLREVYLPRVSRGSRRNGNWELSMMEAATGIAVHLDDRSAYRKAIGRFLKRVPAYIYLEADGRLPKRAPGSGLRGRRQLIDYWHGRSTFKRGLTQETCRDFTHTGYGLAAISHVAETSRIQRRSLYPSVGARLRHALGFHARYELRGSSRSRLCQKPLDLGLGPVTEIGLNAMSERAGRAMSNTRRLTLRRRPAGTNDLFVAWETLTHAGNPR
jgi:hypothetical protein